MDAPDWSLQRDLIRLLVKRVEVDHDEINVVFRVAPPPASLPPGPEGGRSWQDCWRGGSRTMRSSWPGLTIAWEPRSRAGFHPAFSRRVFALWVLGLAASRKQSRARSGFRAQRQRAVKFAAHQCAIRDHEQAEQTKLADLDAGGRAGAGRR